MQQRLKNSLFRYKNRPYREKPPEWWEKQKGSRGIRRGQWYRLFFNFLYVQICRASGMEGGALLFHMIPE
ncbi:hypothetical protein DMH20_27170 [Escherichia coli]|nr:hypothetical protein [Escherichia coli]